MKTNRVFMFTIILGLQTASIYPMQVSSDQDKIAKLKTSVTAVSLIEMRSIAQRIITKIHQDSFGLFGMDSMYDGYYKQVNIDSTAIMYERVIPELITARLALAKQHALNVPEEQLRKQIQENALRALTQVMIIRSPDRHAPSSMPVKYVSTDDNL